MKIELKSLPKSQIELSIELTSDDMEPYLDSAAKAISAQNPIKGFRPGFAPKDVVAREYGEEKLKNVAAENAVNQSLEMAVSRQKLDAIGEPKVSDVNYGSTTLTTKEDGDGLSYKAVLSVIPEVDPGDYKKIKIPLEKFEVEDKEVDDVLENLRKSRAENTPVSRPAEKGDKLEIDFTVKKGDVKIDGGDSKQHPIILGENHFIAGFEDNLIGMKENESKSFSLITPQNYHDQNIAGQKLDFEVKVHQVQERKIPELSDEFAKTLGRFVSVQDLKNNVSEGLRMEKETKARDERRAKITEALVKNISVELPDELVRIELNKMFMELSESLGRMNLTLENYLNHIGKTPEELKKDWDPQAVKRVKAALALKEIAKRENIEVSDQEIEERLSQILRNAPPMQPGQNLDLTTIRGYVRGIIRNEKVFALLEAQA